MAHDSDHFPAQLGRFGAHVLNVSFSGGQKQQCCFKGGEMSQRVDVALCHE
jgi:hypothetical protein